MMTLKELFPIEKASSPSDGTFYNRIKVIILSKWWHYLWLNHKSTQYLKKVIITLRILCLVVCCWLFYKITIQFWQRNFYLIIVLNVLGQINLQYGTIQFLSQGQPVEYKSCNFPACSRKESSNILTQTSTSGPTEKSVPNFWRPLSNSESTSPCSCGCIFIVSRMRELSITSGIDCPTLPISWKLKVI